MGAQVTFDTSALIALERHDKRLRILAKLARSGEITITLPAVVLTEWWRGTPHQARLLEGMVIEPTTERIAKQAGLAIAKLGSTSVDAIVMTSAALRGDVVWTSDLEDLQRLQVVYPDLRLFRA